MKNAINPNKPNRKWKTAAMMLHVLRFGGQQFLHLQFHPRRAHISHDIGKPSQQSFLGHKPHAVNNVPRCSANKTNSQAKPCKRLPTKHCRYLALGLLILIASSSSFSFGLLSINILISTSSSSSTRLYDILVTPYIYLNNPIYTL